MAKISEKDFTYHKSVIKEDEQTHHWRMMRKNLPESVIGSYEGFLFAHDNNDIHSGTITDAGHGIQPNDPNVSDIFQDAGNIIEDWMAIAADTVIPGLYYQAPRPNIRNRPAGSQFTAEILNGLVQHYFDEKAKKENQKAIMDAYLAYGFGVVKVGYNSRVGVLDNQRSNLFTGETKAKGKDIDMESSTEYVKYERPFVERVSPRNCKLDWSKEFGKGQRVTFDLDRNLQEIINSNLYSLPSNFVKYFKSKSGDNRSIKLKLKEHWVILGGFAWKLVYTDEWDEPLAWTKTPYQWLPMSLVRFKDPPDVLYARSHGSIANSGQRELNYENELWKEHIDKARNLIFVDETGLNESGSKTLQSNPIHGIVGTKRPPGTVAANVQSNPMSSDIFSNIANVRAYLQQTLSAGGAVSGDVSADTATQERGVQLGNFLRTSGIQDAIRDFNIDQIKKMTTCIVNWGDPEVTVAITGKNIQDPETGEIATGRDVVIGGDKGIPLKELIIGNIESDYIYDMDMSNAARPDFAVIRKQLNEYGTFLAAVEPKLNAQGEKVEWGKLAKNMGSTFDTLPDSENIITKMTEDEVAAFQEQQALAQQQEFLKGASKPTEEAVVRGAESTGVPQGAV